MLIAWIALGTFAGIFGLAVCLTLLHNAGTAGRRLVDVLCRAPFLDLLVAWFTILPWIPACWFAGWAGLGVALVAQVLALATWVIFHEWVYRRHVAGPRIVSVINRAVGRWRNHAALWVTVVVLPVFWLIRAAQIALYPLLCWLLGFPRYRQGDWVNCSRHKFDGLVGHDLIWCLYCDWMTGVYSLGAEMLRNVESFWCPIRFYDGKKCENCRLDFPDLDAGWVRADGSMSDVESTMKQMYGDGPGGRREWFGHPARRAAAPDAAAAPTRVTIEGQTPPSP
ncbi:MAG: hypothetical protein AB7K52_01255 [Phycisphaerales bacterium]